MLHVKYLLGNGTQCFLGKIRTIRVISLSSTEIAQRVAIK